MNLRKKSLKILSEDRTQRLERVYRLAAGLIQLGDLADRLADAVAEAVYHYIPELRLANNTILEQYDVDIFHRTMSNLGVVKDWAVLWVGDIAGDAQVLKVPEADHLFKDTQVEVRGIHGHDGARGSFSEDWSRPNINGVVNLFLASIIYAALSTGVKFEHALKRTILHELRHAADRAYHVAGNASWQKQRVSPYFGGGDHAVDYFNRPTELKSWAGNIAEDLVSRHGVTLHRDLQDWDHLRASLLVTGNDEILNLIQPENRQRFLQMIYSEVTRLLQKKHPIDLSMNQLKYQVDVVAKKMWDDVMQSGEPYRNYHSIIFGKHLNVDTAWNNAVSKYWGMFPVLSPNTKTVFEQMLSDKLSKIFFDQYKKDNPERFSD